MKTLFLDTSSFYINIATSDNDKIVVHHQEKNDQKLSERIFFLIEDVIEKSNFLLSDIDKIYVVNGPGSFTGIRVGITIAKTLAWNLKIPICTISTLMMMSSGYKETTIPLIKDRNGFVYSGLYNEEAMKSNDIYIKLEELVISNKKYKFLSYEEVEGVEVFEPKVDIIEIIKKFKDEKENVHSVKSNYIKKMDVEKWLGNLKFLIRNMLRHL